VADAFSIGPLSAIQFLHSFYSVHANLKYMVWMMAMAWLSASRMHFIPYFIFQSPEIAKKTS